MPTRTPFGKLLVEHLQLNDLTQADLAGELGVHEDTVSAWVTGKHPPHGRHLPAISRRLDLRVDALAKALADSSYQGWQHGRRGYGVASWDDVVRWGWSSTELLTRLIEIDCLLIDRPDYKEKDEGTPEQWGPIFEKYHELWRLVTYGRANIVGYWHIAVLSDALYALAMKGRLRDSMISLETWDDFGPPDYYKAYIAFIGMIPEHHKILPRNMLFRSFVDQLLELARMKVYFQELYACSFTTHGDNACTRSGMKHVCKHQEIPNTNVFKIDMIPYPKHTRFCQYDDLKQEYAGLAVGCS